MKKYIFLIVLLLSGSLFSQWADENLSGLSPKARNAIFELRRLSSLGVIDDVWFVDANNGASTNGGRSWDKAVTTITKALTLAGDYDVIMVAPGDYEELETQNITEAGLKILGFGTDNQNVAMIYVADSSQHAFTVNANNVEIGGIGFTINEDGYDAIRIATTASAYKTWIHDCRFDGYGQGEYAIHTGTTYDSPDLIVENCVFRSWQTAAIYANATRAIYRNNKFLVDAGKIGIEVIPTTSNRPDQQILDNVISGANSTDTGIKITNSPNQDALVIAGNHVVNCATPITESKYTTWYDGNYWGVEDGQYHSSPRTLYLDAGITTAGDGRSLKSALKTLVAAEAAASTDFKILVEPADYNMAAATTIDVEGLQIIGRNSSNNNHAVMFYADADAHCIIVKAHNVLIENVGFINDNNNKDCIHIGDTDGQAYWKLTVRNCKFDGYGTSEYGIRSGATAGDAGAPDAPDITIEGCHFREFATACIQDNWTRSQIRNNTMFVSASTIGIEIVPTTGSRPDRIISGNTIIGSESSDTGIKITNSPTAGTFAIVHNTIVNCNTDITTGKGDNMSVYNYISSATGGAIFDPSP